MRLFLATSIPCFIISVFGIMNVAAQGTASIAIENSPCVISNIAFNIEDCESSPHFFWLNGAKYIEKEITRSNIIKVQQKAGEEVYQSQPQKGNATGGANIKKQAVEFVAVDNYQSNSSRIETFLSNSDNLVVLSYIAIGAFTLLFFLGFTDSIIVYRDVTEFIWSLAIIIVPIATFFALALLGPEETPPDYNIFWTTSQEKIVTSIGVLFSLLAVAKTFRSCLANNGTILGPIMFLFKLVASVISVLVVIGVANKLFAQNRSIKSVVVAMIVFGLFSFFLNRLINGERVMLKDRKQIGQSQV